MTSLVFNQCSGNLGAFLTHALEQWRAAVFLIDREFCFVYVNEQACRSLGYSREELLAMRVFDIDSSDTTEQLEARRKLVADVGSATFESHHRTKDGRMFPVEVSISFASLDGRTMSFAIARDITERKNYQEQLYKLAYSDTLTSLPNRALFRDRLQRAVQDAGRDNTTLGMLFIDLDGFKEVNDTLGHDIGDELLKIVAARFSSMLRPEDTVARLGGDEFAVLLQRVRQEVDLAIVARKLLAVVRAPVTLSGRELFVTASVGIACFPSDSRDTTGLLGCADVAMYQAKASGKNSFKFYSVSMTRAAAERMELENDLRKALPQGELEVYYQPKVHTIIGQMVGAEALLRWHHPTRGLVPPDKFIGIAEDTGLICDIGAWVLHRACLTASEWNKDSLYPVKVAVNLSARQLVSGDFADKTRTTLAATGCRPEWLELEITESMLMTRNGEIAATLNELDAMGIGIAIDDFGTGYSSLLYLTEFPIRTIKIDKSFVNGITVEKRKLELVRAIVSMGGALGMEMVAEGVETGEQAACLDRLGCHIIQGYFYGKPMPLSGFEGWRRDFTTVRQTENGNISPDFTPAWRDFLTTGHPLVDAQHRELFRHIGALNKACLHHETNSQISAMLNYLEEYVKSHFAAEEELLVRINSPHYTEHRAAHDSFSKTAGALIARCKREGESPELAMETNYVAVEWLTRHICTMDRDLADRLRQYDGE